MWLNKWYYSIDIPEDVDEYASDIMLETYRDRIEEFKCSDNKRSAMIYCIGPSDHHMNSRVIRGGENRTSNAVVMSQSWYYTNRYARLLGNLDYVTISANTCADTMWAIHQARMLIEYEGFDEVVVVAEEVINKNTTLLFTQLGIDVPLGDGFVIAKFSNEQNGVEIKDTAWEFKMGSSPMSFDADGYMKVVKKLEKWGPKYVKSHGTGTTSNDKAEGEVIKYLGAEEIRYKDKIGHTQGVSALLEICMCIDDGYEGTVLALASGAGGFYGGCIVEI